MSVLYIDTRDNKKITVRLEAEKEIFEKKSLASKKRSQATLPLVQEVLKKSGLEFKDIDGIKVERGPGSFTGLKVGISIANALSFSLLKKVNGKALGEIELPEY